ncbi:MAG: response regulator [Sphingomonadaceae bacterium]
MNTKLAENSTARTVPLWLLLGVALIVSGGLFWLATQSIPALAAYSGGLAVIAAMAFAATRPAPSPSAESFSAPDWSVTVEAIDQADAGIAITDRANRLVCANENYTRWFGAIHAPPQIAFERSSLEAISKAMREAWRDTHASIPRISMQASDSHWRVSVSRAGRGDDYLVWRFHEIRPEDPGAGLYAMLGGGFGNLLSQAGIEAAIVGPDGIILTASSGFASRAAGDGEATMAGQDFVSQLRSDDNGQIYFAREGRRGSPMSLVHVPLYMQPAETVPGAGEADSLMLLVDNGVGIGGQVEEAGRGQAQELEALLGALPLGLAMTDRDGRFLFGNQAFLRAVGCEDVRLPAFPSDLVVKEDKGVLADTVRRFGRGSTSHGNMAVRLKNIPDDPVSLGLAGVRGLGEASVLLSLADSTEETRLKRQVAQATKMQAVGQLAGGVAHDFNNVLTAIIGYCDLMLLRHTPGDSDYDDIQQIRANSNRAASLTRQLLAFSRQQTLRPEVLQLPDIVSEVSQLLKRLIGEKIVFKVHHDRDLAPVRADPQQLEQVIVNLAVNARDAMQAHGDGTGTLTMTTRKVSARDIRQMGSDIIPISDYTVLVVQDTGGGIPPVVLGKIFEPFFTTKDQGKGTGLGLSTVYGIVKQSGGFIFADNVPGTGKQTDGARFTIYLPAYHDASPVIPAQSVQSGDGSTLPAPQPASEWSGGGHILLVEDEDMVRAVAERALTRAGFDVVACADGEEGLTEIGKGSTFDLVVTDVVMPGMDGPSMARAIRKVKPNLPILFMSGYAEEQLRADIDIEAMYFLPKPFSVKQISEKVAEVLENSQ